MKPALALLSVLVLVLLGLSRTAPETPHSALAPKATASEAASLLRLAQPQRRVRATPEETTPGEVPTTGSMAIRFVDRDPTDRFVLRASVDGVIHSRVKASEDNVALLDLPVGSVVFELGTARGRVLASTTQTVSPGERGSVELVWPARLEGQRQVQLHGSLRVPAMVDEAGLFERLSLNLIPLYDSPAQERSGIRTIRQSVSRLTQVTDDTYSWALDSVPVGTYLLKVVPIGHVQEVRVEAADAPQFVEVDPGELGHALLTFLDPSGRVVHPEHVSVTALRGLQRPLATPLEEITHADSYDIISVPGALQINFRDPTYGNREFLYEMPTGWSEVEFAAPPALLANVSIHGSQPFVDLEKISIAPQGGGRVLSSVMRYPVSVGGPSVLMLQVDKPGSYACRYEHEEHVEELLIEVHESGQELRWDLATLEQPSTRESSGWDRPLSDFRATQD